MNLIATLQHKILRFGIWFKYILRLSGALKLIATLTLKKHADIYYGITMSGFEPTTSHLQGGYYTNEAIELRHQRYYIFTQP